MGGIIPGKYQDYIRGNISYEEATGGQKQTTANTPFITSGYTAPSSSVSYTAPATSYTGSANQIGNVAGSSDLFKSYQNIHNQQRTGANQYKQLNTWVDNNGTVYDTTDMTPQQIFALSLAKNGNQNAAAVLKGMGLDMNGNPTSSAPTVTNYASYKPPMQTGTLVPTSSNAADYADGGKYASYNVNDQSFQDKTEAEKQAIFASNPTLAAQEVQRAKQVWAENKDNPERQALAHAWADKVRGWAGLPADGAESSYTPSVKPTQDIVKDESPEEKFLKGLAERIDQSLKAISDPNSSVWAGQKAAAETQAKAEYDAKLGSYQNLLNSLKTGQKNDLEAITNSLDTAKSDIEDNSFQKWLEARQGIANRGLAGSGLASDADTRLLLSKQKNLANLYNTKSAAINDVNKRYADQINTANTNIAGLNLPAMQAAAFQKLFQDGSKTQLEVAKIYESLLKEKMGNETTANSDAMKYSFEKYQTDKEYAYKYDKLNQDGQVKAAQLALDWKKYGLDVAKVMGVDENGNMTLDARKMVAEISQKAQQMAITQAHNAVMEKQGWARIDQTDKEMDIKLQAMENQTSQFEAKMKLDKSKANDAQLGKQVDAIKAIMTEEGSNLRSIRTKLDSKDLSDAQKESLTAEYAQSLSKIEAAQNSMGEIYKFKTGKTVQYSGDAPKPFNMNDMDGYGDNSDSIG
jgi:hypothetical protein